MAGRIGTITEDAKMPAIVEFAQIVREAVAEFSDSFSCEPQRQETGALFDCTQMAVAKWFVLENRPRRSPFEQRQGYRTSLGKLGYAGWYVCG